MTPSTATGETKSLRQYEYKLICFKTAFCFANISAKITQKLVLYFVFTYGSQFSGEKKQFENLILGCQDIKQKPSLIFLGHPVELRTVRIMTQGDSNM